MNYRQTFSSSFCKIFYLLTNIKQRQMISLGLSLMHRLFKELPLLNWGRKYSAATTIAKHFFQKRRP